MPVREREYEVTEEMVVPVIHVVTARNKREAAQKVRQGDFDMARSFRVDAGEHPGKIVAVDRAE